MKHHLAFAEHNQPVMITTTAMGGISGPLDLMGIALQQNAELLAGTIYVQLVNPGNPVVWSPTVSNWDNYSEWENSGFEDAAIAANNVWKERLLNAPETFLVPEVDKDLTAFIESHN